MKVHNHALEAYAQSTVARTAEAASATATQPAKLKKATSTEATLLSISSEARALAVSATPTTTDAEKVASLRERIQDGSFQVDAGKIAERLLDRLA
jgi:negative regulator of flagellin synthesis FlgM